MACSHKFQGDKNGVKCLLCGLRMTAEEYAASLTKKAGRKKKEVKADE